MLADDAARRVLVQLKGAACAAACGSSSRSRWTGRRPRDSRPGAVRKLARGEPVGASPERRERRRRSRSRGRKRAEGGGEQPAAAVEAQPEAS